MSVCSNKAHRKQNTNLNLVADLEHALQDAAPGNSALEVVDGLTWLVHVERTNHDQSRLGNKIPHLHR